jgi:hypothetical protein
MKVSFVRRTLAALVLVAGAVAIFFWWSHRGQAVEPVSSTPGNTSATHTQQIARAPDSLAGDPSNSDGTPPSDDYDDNPMANILRPLLANDVQLDTFMYFHNRPLLDEAGTARYHQFLSDPAMLAAVKHDLLYPEETKVDAAGNIKRLMKIDYLREAVEWQDNPARGEIISQVGDMLLTDNYPTGMGMDMRLSLSGNKMELYELLSEVAPDQAASLLQASKGTRLENLLGYIANSLQVRKQIEANLETEVRPK